MGITREKIKELSCISWELRLDVLEMFSYGKAHHFGGSLSCIEILSSLYFYKMNFNKDNYEDRKHDKFIMSKGHSVPAQYAVLARLGIIPKEELKTIKVIGARLQGHPDKLKTPGIEAPTGSLGQGLSYANGIALADRADGLETKFYVLLGDGELQEGQVWEAAMTTSHYNLCNVCAIVDRNKFQSQGEVDVLKRVSPVDKKFESFGWDAVCVDGHDIESICKALDMVGNNKRPLAIIADTVKGKGIPFIENTYKYHNYSMSKSEYGDAHDELQKRIADMKKELD